jgi:anti-sigma-K factor RskA
VNQYDLIDLSSLRDQHWADHADRLASRVAAGLGEMPRRLPTPLQLTFELAAGRVAASAAAVVVIAIACAQLWGTSGAEAPSIADLIGGERAPTAADVYLAMRGQLP